MAATDIGQLTRQQMTRAKRVFDVACEYAARDPDVVLAALCTVNNESSFRVWANDGSYAGEQREQIWKWYGGQQAYQRHMLTSLTFPHDAVAGSEETTKDSVNLIQQREMYGYAGYGPRPHPDAMARMMDPDWAVRVFIDGVPGQPGVVRSWFDPRMPKGLTIPQRCQWVQGSEFPTGENYLEALFVAFQLIDRFGGIPQPKEWLDMVTRDEFKAALQEVIGEKLDRIIDGQKGWHPADPEQFVQHAASGTKRALEQVGGVWPADPERFVEHVAFGVQRAAEKDAGK